MSRRRPKARRIPNLGKRSIRLIGLRMNIVYQPVEDPFDEIDRLLDELHELEAMQRHRVVERRR